ncbi:TPA: hypothetical protein NKB29_004612 [Vibrio parahaemolyticus]|uniref:hypothetical protein n=1 Tax=Vibrio parahaemolyticus TaxID=670 RepID=UPI001F17BFD4|nr:hypothetical protein [Vibrio parahaemolyticus]MCG0010919.1 hypothetical protein [Vibrio parahaemolyticus]MDL1996793.1 hypothetical protein [Vibrio parahaemolyticus]HCH0088962.1 hypothetical protein [Vibrio parahaemolyticus]
MIAIIIMIMMFLGFFTVVAYNMISINHNLVVSAEAETIENELELIKTKLIKSALSIQGKGIYSLPFGLDSGNKHSLPLGLGLPLRNISGYEYQYCPFSKNIEEGTLSVSQNVGENYTVNVKKINDIDYVVNSSASLALPNAPTVAALIISKYDDEQVNCFEVEYDLNTAQFYLNNAKVKSITFEEIELYNSFSLENDELLLNVDSSTVNDMLALVENDTSNRSYKLNLLGDVVLNNDYEINRDERAKITIKTNGYALQGQSISFNNVDLNMYNDAKTTSDNLTNFDFANSQVRLSNVSIGDVSIANAEAHFNNVHLKNDTLHPITLMNSSLDIEGELLFEPAVNFQSLIRAKGSDVALTGTINEKLSSGQGDNLIYVDTGSNFYMNTGAIALNKSLKNGVDLLIVKGSFSTSNQNNGIAMIEDDRINDLIRVDGGEIYIDNLTTNISSNSGFAVNQILQQNEYQGSVIIKSILNSGLSGCLNLVRKEIDNGLIVNRHKIIQCS